MWRLQLRAVRQACVPEIVSGGKPPSSRLGHLPPAETAPSAVWAVQVLLEGHTGWVRSLAIEGRWLFSYAPAAPASVRCLMPVCSLPA